MKKSADAVIISVCLMMLAHAAAGQEKAPPSAPLLIQTIGDKQIEMAVEIALGLTEQPLTEIHVDYKYRSAEFRMPTIYKPQKYTLNGYARLKPGKRVGVEGSGILLSSEYLLKTMEKPTALAGFLAAWQGIVRDISRADPDRLSAYRIHWQTPGPLNGGDELGTAEKRLATSLPPIYRETMRRSGPWKVSFPNGFSFELLAPSQLMTATEWLEKYDTSIVWDTPENQVIRQRFARDIVFAIVNNEPWVLRRSGVQCNDEQPSFATAKTSSAPFYVDAINACGAGQQLEAMRQLTMEALHAALPAPDFTIVTADKNLHFEPNESQAEQKKVSFFLKADE